MNRAEADAALEEAKRQAKVDKSTISDDEAEALRLQVRKIILQYEKEEKERRRAEMERLYESSVLFGA